MDAQRIAVAQACLDGAYDKTMSFPDIVRALSEAGFEGYAVDYRCGTATYFCADGDHVVLDNRPTDGKPAAAFDAAGIAGQIKWAQTGAPDYSYQAFCRNVKAMGCAGYIVSLLGRRVLYFGRTAETHVELMPQ